MLSSAAFESIEKLAGTDSTRVWAAEEEYARRERIYDVTVMDIYDIMCQWSVHMKDRVASSRHLKIPDGLELRLGIGLFHIHGHRDTCLARYSPSFIEGG